VDLTPTTELQAVNQLLASIGEAPVNALETSGLADVATARQALHTISRRVQQKGWQWNTLFALTLALSPEGEARLPANTLKVDTSGNSRWIKVAQRGNRLFNQSFNSYNFDGPVTVDLVEFLAFEQLPEAARHYITVAAARLFQENFVGSTTLSSFGKDDEMNAWADLQAAEAENADYNVLTDNTTVAGILYR